jgi:riboflavin kinase / FMN adenylyltransferase
MRIHPGLFSAVGKLPRGAIAIGNFDGVHLGHRALFAAASVAARRHGGPSCALTFEPHPARVLAPQVAPRQIASPGRKRELMLECGVEDLVVQTFDAAFARTDPRHFVEALIATGIAEVVVGHDFTYGKDRGGSVDSLRLGLEERGVRLHLVSPVTHEGLVVSSTKVREFALEGRLAAAAALLGRPLDLDGTVVRGAGRGRTLGWPTANVQTDAAQLLPAIGVYAVRAQLVEEPGACPDGTFVPPRLGKALAGAANLGINPTFRESGVTGDGAKPPLLLEVHLLDFAADIYGRELRISFVQRLRNERRFPHVDALKAQIAQDVSDARQILTSAAGS